jgi:hypothetical protein
MSWERILQNDEPGKKAVSGDFGLVVLPRHCGLGGQVHRYRRPKFVHNAQCLPCGKRPQIDDHAPRRHLILFDFVIHDQLRKAGAVRLKSCGNRQIDDHHRERSLGVVADNRRCHNRFADPQVGLVELQGDRQRLRLPQL